jgi:redox-sensing transcriptional repressor
MDTKATPRHGATSRRQFLAVGIAAAAGGVIATPASAAQDVADRLVAAGVSSILNFAPTVISVPDEVSLRKVDLAVELQILSFYQQRRSGGPTLAAVVPAETSTG